MAPDLSAIRQTVRFRWIDHALAADVTRNVCRLDPDEATQVMRWAATSLVRAAMSEAR